MNEPLTAQEITVAAFALQFERTMCEEFLNRNVNDGLRNAVKSAFRHQVVEYVRKALLRTDACERLDLDVQHRSNPTELDMHATLDGEHDPNAIKKMADWTYPTATQVAADKKARMEAYQRACEEQRAKDEERRKLQLTVGKAMADSLANELDGGSALTKLLDSNMEARRVYHDVLAELRSGGFDED